MTKKIICSAYTRDDGLDILQIYEGKWAVRKNDGLLWFYSNDNEWIISSLVDRKFSNFLRPFDEAMKLLETLPEVDRNG